MKLHASFNLQDSTPRPHLLFSTRIVSYEDLTIPADPEPVIRDDMVDPAEVEGPVNNVDDTDGVEAPGEDVTGEEGLVRSLVGDRGDEGDAPVIQKRTTINSYTEKLLL